VARRVHATRRWVPGERSGATEGVIRQRRSGPVTRAPRDCAGRTDCLPDRAVQRDESGPFVYVVRPDHTAAVHPVKPRPSAEGFTAILSGIAPGDSVAFDGQS
jgi:multidrug efflux pump subunit AcrA (membrane-fusion protein)